MEPVNSNNQFLGPKILIAVGIVVIGLTIGINYAYSWYTQQLQNTQTTQDDELPSGTAQEVDQDSFTFSSEEQKFSIDYPKGITLRELQKKYYKKSARLFESGTEFISSKKPTDINYFKVTVNVQRIYRDNQDQVEYLSNMLTPLRICPKGNFNKASHSVIDLNESKYTVTPNVQGCASPYATFYESFTQPAVFVIQINTNQPYEKIRKNTDQLLNNLYLDHRY